MDLVGTSRLHYDLIEKIGEGGMGIVYKAFDNKLKRHVAIKFLPWRIANNPAMRARFQIEAQAVATLNHPNIATIHAIEEIKGPANQDEIFFVMEYIDGQELKKKIKRGDIELPEAVEIALQVAEGLHAAHEKGITHRDIKPANIMLTAKGRVKLMDFGLAKIGPGVQLTKTNTTLGTVSYMSPEQARGGKVDNRSDIWSFGVVLYEMLSGALPFQADFEHALIYAIVNNEPFPLEERDAAIPRPLLAIVERTLKKNPAYRYPDVEALIRDLRSYADELLSSMRIETSTEQNPPHTYDSAGPPVTRVRRPSSDIPTSPRSVHATARPASTRFRYLIAAGFFTILTAGGLFWWVASNRNAPAEQNEASIPPINRPERSPATTSGSDIDGGDTAPLDPIQPGEPVDVETEERVTPPVASSDPPETELPPSPAESPPEIEVEEENESPPLQESIAAEADPAAMQRAMDARSEMNRAAEQVPGDEAFKASLPAFLRALQTLGNAQESFDSALYPESTDLFTKAESEFLEARREADGKLESAVREALASVERLRLSLDEYDNEGGEYRQALARVDEANQAFSAGDLFRALQLYRETETVFERVADEMRREAEVSRQVETRRADAKIRIKEAFESHDIEKLEAIVVLSDNTKAAWENLFSRGKNNQIAFADEALTPLGNLRYQLDLTTDLTFTDSRNNRQQNTFVLSGTISNNNGDWTTTKFSIK